jgi:hypothetical protein
MIYLPNYITSLDCRHSAPTLSFIFILHFRSTPRNLDINTMKQVFINKPVVTRLSNPSFSVMQCFIAACITTHHSSDGIVTDYGLDGPRIEFRWGARFFAHVQTGPGAHPASCTMDTGSFPGVKRPGRGADHPPPCSAEVDKE